MTQPQPPQAAADPLGERNGSGAAGGPPYLVRFDDGHTGLCYPGPDAVVEPKPKPKAKARKAAAAKPKK